MTSTTALLPFQPDAMTPALLAAVIASYRARHTGQISLYTYQLRRWFTWRETNTRLGLSRFLEVAQALTVHHGALAYLLGINSLRASEAG